MPRVVVNAAAPAGPNDLRVVINEQLPTFMLRPVGIPKNIIYRMSPRTFDLLLLAAAVFTADSLTRRGGSVRSEMGSKWYRDFRFVVPVRDPEFWRSAQEPLVETLGFLTGDRFDFTFVPRAHDVLRQGDLDLGRPAEVDQVILFSGGLDSLAGAFETLSSTDDRLLLVTHRSASKIASLQKTLVGKLRRDSPKRITWVPVRGHLIGQETRETTQRSRSFLYAALGYAAATLVGLPRIRFYENGIVSLNLPINRQVVDTMATRTTHPLFLHRLEGLLSLVAESPITVENPFANLTKTEVVARLRDLGGSDLIEATTSCSSVRPRRREKPHCGSCSQCLDRRFAVLACGVENHDPPGRYEVDVLLGSRDHERDQTMAHDWTRHAARHLARMSPQAFWEKFAAELADLAAARPSSARGSALVDAFHMHRRHGEAVRRVVEEVISRHSDWIVDRKIPPGSLLAALLEDAFQPEEDAPIGSVPPDGPPLPGQPAGMFPLRLVFDPDRGPWLRIAGLGEFTGAHLTLVSDLKPQHDEDCAENLAAAAHRYVPSGSLGPKGKARQRAKRCRDAFAEAYECIEGSRPEAPILVQTGERSGQRFGYRLDPEARFVDSGSAGDWMPA